MVEHRTVAPTAGGSIPLVHPKIPLRHMRWRVLPVLLLSSCASRSSPVADARADGAPPDTAPPADAGPLPLVVDFTVANCPSLDSSVPSCTGMAPFTIQFAPIATTLISQYLWNFGDGTSNDTSANPSHTFSAPGSFDVTLVGVGSTGGVATRTRPGFIIVLANGLGAPCRADQQCAQGLYCLCSAASPCTTGPMGGMCTSLCQKGDCPVGDVCANLETAAANAGLAEPWQTQLCLPSCHSDADCTAGLRCRTLPGWPNAVSSAHGCFADVPADLGGPCLDANGVRRNDLCVTGLCADLGALGLCTRDCSSALCPAGSDCAVFGDGRELCLLPCSSSFPCDQDPLLTCAAPGLSLLGYHLKTTPSSGQGSAYCAPKACLINTDCGAAGLCREDTGGGHCVARSQ
jgi:PKD repeat protein